MLLPALKQAMAGAYKCCYECSNVYFIEDTKYSCPDSTTFDDYLCVSCDLFGGCVISDNQLEQLNYDDRYKFMKMLFPSLM